MPDAFDPRTLADAARRSLPDAPHVADALERASSGFWDGRAFWRTDSTSNGSVEHHRIDRTPVGAVVVDLDAEGRLLGVEILARL